MPRLESAGCQRCGASRENEFCSATNPAAAGSIVTVYGAGLGAITPSQPDGSRIGLRYPPTTSRSESKQRTQSGFLFGAEVDVPFEVEYVGPAPQPDQLPRRTLPFLWSNLPAHGIDLQPGFSIHVAGQ
jgi:uncharacterized protein (TIGR03437 family)